MLSKFVRWYHNDFHQDPLYNAMALTSEDSPWHRESDVGTHTDMVVAMYMNTGDFLTHDDLNGAFACAFHDVGKPAALEHAYSEERGHYKRFHGHEQISARMWEDWAMRNWPFLRDTFQMSVYDIYRIGFMVEHHLPWALKDKRKLDNLAQTISTLYLRDVFPRVLLADTYGRISDDAPDKEARSEAWVQEFHPLVDAFEEWEYSSPKNGQPVLMMPIAPSGAGKSTLYASVQNAGYEYFSWDALRLKWYANQLDVDEKEKYRIAFESSTRDKNFNAMWQREFVQLVKTGKHIYVDNTNLTRKRRRFFLEEARRHGYYTMAYLLPIAEQTLIDRQTSRSDKDVPPDAVRRQYRSLQLPLIGEFDDVMVYDHHL